MRVLSLMTVPVLALAVVDPGHATAQNRREIRVNGLESVTPSRATFTPTLAAKPLHTRLLSALGGAVLGAGMGFFASQVVKGDWEEGPNGRVDRPAWAAVGGSIGLALGFSFPLGGRPGNDDPLANLPGGRFRIDASEFDKLGITNALEAVQTLRPEWLNPRGVHVIGESATESIDVYLDNNRLGGVSSMRDVQAKAIRSMHYFDAAAATVRYGAGHSHGVILIIGEGGPPRTRS